MSESIQGIGANSKTNVVDFINKFKKMSMNGDAKFSVNLPLFGYGFSNNTPVNGANNGENVGAYRTRI